MKNEVPHDLESAFGADTLVIAREIVAGYHITTERSDRPGFIGSSIELPTVFAEASTPSECYNAAEEALTGAVATMIECGQKPPQSSLRTEQASIRLTPYEKAWLSQRATDLGFKGVSDFIRNRIISSLS